MGFMKNGKYRPTDSKGCNECHGTGMVKVASPTGGTEKLKCLACRPIQGNEKYLKREQDKEEHWKISKERLKENERRMNRIKRR